jgi:hypothetical protein
MFMSGPVTYHVRPLGPLGCLALRGRRRSASRGNEMRRAASRIKPPLNCSKSNRQTDGQIHVDPTDADCVLHYEAAEGFVEYI